MEGASLGASADPRGQGFEGLFRLCHRSAHDGSDGRTGRRRPVSGKRVIGWPGFYKVSSRCRDGDATIQPTELLEGRNWLGFAGIYPTKFVAISKEQQFAEKLHAYTLPRLEGTNTRVKDVVDMALLLRLGTLDRERLREAIDTTFALRNTHMLPVILPEPPASWNAPYQALAAECSLAWTLQEAIQNLGRLLSDEISE